VEMANRFLLRRNDGFTLGEGGAARHTPSVSVPSPAIFPIYYALSTIS
jgi:hypothetical protein